MPASFRETFMDRRKKPAAAKNTRALDLLRRHFKKMPIAELSVTTRTLAHRVRADLQLALGDMFDGSARRQLRPGRRARRV